MWLAAAGVQAQPVSAVPLAHAIRIGIIFPLTGGLADMGNSARVKRPVGSLMSAAQSYDAVHLVLRGLFESKQTLTGPALKGGWRPSYDPITAWSPPTRNHSRWPTAMQFRRICSVAWYLA